MKNQAFNPFLPGWEYIPDGEPHVFGDRVYLYGSHDRFNGEGFCLNKYVGWSAPVDDLSDWHFHGEIFDVDTDPFNADGKYQGYAPDACRGPDGRYYLLYALNNDQYISVAVCDTPAGKFEFYGHIKTRDGRIYGGENTDVFCFDPAVLVDDDGRVHLYVGFSASGDMPEVLHEHQKRCRCDGGWHIELESDMVTMKTEPKLVCPGHYFADGTSYEKHGFFEGPSMRKFGGKYYFIYSSCLYHELCYGIGDAPEGPFEFMGTLVSNGDIGYKGREIPVNHMSNNHGSVEKVGDDYYIFYHRHTNKTMYSRQACAEKLTMNDDGTFDQVEITSCGLNGGPLRAEGEYSARIACNIFAWMDNPAYLTQNGVDRECDDDQYISNMTDASWIGFKYFDFKGGEKVSVKVKSTADAVLEVSHDREKEPFARIEIKKSEDIAEFTADRGADIGVLPLYFTYKGEGSADIISIGF